LPEFLRYRFKPDEVLRYEQIISVIIEDPAKPEPVVGFVRLESQLRTVEVHEDTSMTIELTGSIKEQNGQVPPLGDELVIFRLTPRGEVLEAKPAPSAIPLIIFPKHPVIKRHTWRSTESSASQKVDMQHTIKDIDPMEGGDVRVEVVSEGAATTSEPSIDVHAVRAYAVKGGHPLDGRIVVRYGWPSGGYYSVIVEEKLLN
jgi:hypothetical protein